MIIPIIIFGNIGILIVLSLFFSPMSTRELKRINKISSRGLIAMKNNDLASLSICIDDFSSMKLKYHPEKADLFISIYKSFISQKISN